jgi:tRNA threonylcarbamoyladenosine biosynthesis protein TsaE
MQYPTSIFIDGLLNVPCFTPAGKPLFGSGFTQRNGRGGFCAGFLSSLEFCPKAVEQANTASSDRQSRRFIDAASHSDSNLKVRVNPGTSLPNLPPKNAATSFIGEALAERYPSPIMPTDDPSNITFDLSCEAETQLLGRALGEAAQPGLVVALVGNLGAGKTRFVQAAAEGLDIPREAVNSPTFVLIHEYEGRLPVYHFDTYRLGDIDEFLELGADEYMSGDGVCFIEWADRMEEVLPKDRLTITFEITGELTRRVRLAAGGRVSQSVLQSLIDHRRSGSA